MKSWVAMGLASTLAGFGFERPWLLLGLVGCALPLLFPPLRLGAWLRAAALALVVLAIAQPHVDTLSSSTAVLVDVSDSVGDAALEAARELAGGFSSADEFLLTAAETARFATLPETIPAYLSTSSTDLARALQLAAAGGAGRILLVSDGVTPEASLLSSLPPVPVDVLVVPSRSGVGLSELLLPSQVAPGQTVQAIAVVKSDVSATLTVLPAVGSTRLEPLEVSVEPGRTAVPFEFTAGDESVATVSVTIQTDRLAGAQRLQRDLGIRARPSILVIDDPAMADALLTQGLDVTVGGVADVSAPLPYSAIVIRGSAALFTPGQLDLINRFVLDGGGLIMTGGPESFGFGAWYRTPVEELLPVTTDLRTEVSLPLVALVMVVDRSQSMATSTPSKIELAKEGAIQVVELAYQDDLLGLIAFSDESSTRWVFELRPATERGKREMLHGILALGTAGGTVLEPAYRQALDALEATEAAVKHVIVLSDGRLYDGQGPFAANPGSGPNFAAIARAGLDAGITTSTIAIGEEADFERLRELAEAGGGRYYEALDVDTLPSIFTNEALTATRALLVDEPTVPQPRPNPVVSFPESLPAVDAYIATSLKSDAQELLAGRDGEPLLAIRRAGLGRTAALTTDLNAWAGDFGEWPGLAGAIGTLGHWLQAVPSSYEASASRDGNQLQVVVDAVRGGEYVNNERLEARFAGVTTVLDQVAPGRYSGSVPWREGAGNEVVIAVAGNVVARASLAGPDPEFADVDGAALLATVAERTGGEVVTAGTYDPSDASATRSLWQLALALALVAFIGELLWRRLTPTGQSPRRPQPRVGGRPAHLRRPS